MRHRNAYLFLSAPNATTQSQFDLEHNLCPQGSLAERVEHRPTGLAEDVGGDAVELDPCVLQRLVQPVGLIGTRLDLRLAIPGQGSQRPLGLGWHEAATQQPGLHQLADPGRIGAVGLAAGDNQEYRLHELRRSLPAEVTITAPWQPLCGDQLAVEGHRRVRGVPCLVVRLPDGTPGTVEVSATSVGAAASDAPAGALLSVEGFRCLRRLLAARAAGGDGSGT